MKKTDLMKISSICKLSQSKLKAALYKQLVDFGYKPIDADGFLYAAGEVPVMLVAHMDTVHHEECTDICFSPDGTKLMSPQGIGGDDRCGIYMILHILQKIRCHVVFTENEEIGCIGAGKFASSDIKPDLKYIIEFDRKGDNDCVFYSCDNPDFVKFVEQFGFKFATGSCSDISKIAPALGVAAVNLSSGYYNPHTIGEYIDMNVVERNIEWTKKMISTQSDKFKYIEKAVAIESYRSYGRGFYGDGYRDIYNDAYDYDTPMWRYDPTTKDWVRIGLESMKPSETENDSKTAWKDFNDDDDDKYIGKGNVELWNTIDLAYEYGLERFLDYDEESVFIIPDKLIVEVSGGDSGKTPSTILNVKDNKYAIRESDSSLLEYDEFFNVFCETDNEVQIYRQNGHTYVPRTDELQSAYVISSETQNTLYDVFEFVYADDDSNNNQSQDDYIDILK